MGTQDKHKHYKAEDTDSVFEFQALGGVGVAYSNELTFAEVAPRSRRHCCYQTIEFKFAGGVITVILPLPIGARKSACPEHFMQDWEHKGQRRGERMASTYDDYGGALVEVGVTAEEAAALHAAGARYQGEGTPSLTKAKRRQRTARRKQQKMSRKKNR